MTSRRLSALLLPLLAMACDEAPPARTDAPVVVVAGPRHSARPAMPQVAHTQVPQAAPPTAAAANPPGDRQKLVSIEASARIRTAEMWSDPIAPTD